MKQALFPQKKTGVKAFVLLLLVLFFMLIFSGIAVILGIFIFEKGNPDVLLKLSENPEAVGRPFLYTIQFFNQIGMLFVPSLLFAWFYGSENLMHYLNTRRFSWKTIFLAVLIIYTLIPFISWLGDINARMTFPPALSWLGDWMKSSEANTDKLINYFLHINTFSGFLVNMLIIAFVPALGEELLFRGIIQPLFKEWTNSVVMGVFLTAFLFSAVHFQFFGFLPRFLLGLILGILLEITHNLWVPIATHFVNNATLVILYFLNQKNIISVDPENFGSTSKFYILIISVLLTVYLLYKIALLQRKVKEQNI